MKRIEVTWRDITCRSGWHSQNVIDNYITDDQEGLVTHLGYKYEEDDNQLVIVDSYFLNKELYGTIHRIPKGCIVSVKEI